MNTVNMDKEEGGTVEGTLLLLFENIKVYVFQATPLTWSSYV